MITTKNYFEQYEKLNILSRFPDVKPYHSFFADSTDNGTNWEDFDAEQETRDSIEAYVAILNRRIAASAGSSKAEDKPFQNSHQQNSASRKTNQQQAKKSVNKKKTVKAKPSKRGGQKGGGNKPKGKPKKVLNLPKGKLVEIVDPHLLFIGRYLRMDNETRSRNSLENFFAQINKAADAKILRKASPHSVTIIYIQQQLLQRLETNAKEFVIHIPPNKVDSMQRAIAKEQQMSSVRLLKRYHGMAGRLTTIEKAKRLYTEFYNAIETGRIQEKDRHFKRITKVIADLTSYIKYEDTTTVLERLPAALGGVLGFMDGCLCQQDRELAGIDTDAPDDIEFGDELAGNSQKKKYGTKAKQIAFVKKKGNIITFKKKFSWKGEKFRQILVTGFEKSGTSVKVIGFTRDTAWYNSMDELLEAIDWEQMEAWHD
jgi:hypothetical protein